MTGTISDLGFLQINKPAIKNAFMEADGSTKTDIFSFKTAPLFGANVSISTVGETSDTFALSLFRDVNRNGILDNGDASGAIRVSDDTPDIGDGANESMNVTLQRDNTFFIRARSFATDDISYTLQALRTFSAANPLTNPEIQLGTIAQDLQRRDRVSDSDNADNFAFTLDGNSSFKIGVRELGNKKGDVNIRVVQDLNSNGFVDKNEVVVKGVSTLKDNVDTITGLNKAGDYILQVCQSQGNSQFEVKFDHSAA